MDVLKIHEVALIMSLFLCSLLHCESFQPLQVGFFDGSALWIKQFSRNNNIWCHQVSSPHKALKANKDDSDRSDDEYIDEDSLGDWRSFRQNLMETDFSSLSPTANEGYIGDGQVVNSSSEGDENSQQKILSDSERRPKSVSKLNEELLLKQNEMLGREYLNGVWAHEAPTIEEGGLVIRLPLEAEIYRSQEGTEIGEELNKRINEDDNETDQSFLVGPSSDLLKKKRKLSVSPQAAKTLFWYRKAQKLIKEKIQGITSVSSENGQVDVSKLKPQVLDFLKLYVDNQESWQEVCLVLDRDSKTGKASTLVLNRPMAFKLTENLARLVLYGASEAMIMQKKGTNVVKTEETVKFLTAFENSCAVYVGGPSEMDNPAIMIHGFANLSGAIEISSGTGVYKGGIPAAIEGVLAGKYSSLDFRFFVGRHQYKDSELDIAVYSSKYQPIACARALVLKQCIQLPKPLWHEILELCGGELREISSLELMERGDIQEED